jgi:hypothetical protein
MCDYHSKGSDFNMSCKLNRKSEIENYEAGLLDLVRDSRTTEELTFAPINGNETKGIGL